MKLPVTKKYIKENFHPENIFSVGYCQLDHLLQFHNPFAYSHGSYGWSCDYYNINGLIISTGYSTIGKDINYDLAKEYNDKAAKVYTREEKTALLSELVFKIREVE